MRDWLTRLCYQLFVCWWRGCRVEHDGIQCIDCGRDLW